MYFLLQISVYIDRPYSFFSNCLGFTNALFCSSQNCQLSLSLSLSLSFILRLKFVDTTRNIGFNDRILCYDTKVLATTTHKYSKKTTTHSGNILCH
jgi:hypothetical protein